jgi:hypothetical protein
MEIQWQNILGGNGSSTVSSLQKTTNGYILAGSSTSFNGNGNSSIYVARVNETGQLLWNQTYAGGLFSNGNNIASVANGYLIAGVEGTDKNPSGVATVLKIDSAGRELWRQDIIVSNSTYSEANYILAQDDGCVVAGYSFAGYADPLYKNTMFLAKILDNGTISWVETFTDVFMYRPLAIQDAVNGYILAGNRYTPYEDIYSGFIAKINDSGGEEWVYQYKPGNYQSYFFGLQKVAEDRYMAAGGYTDMNQTTGAYLVTVNETGIMQQYNTFPNVTNGMITSMAIDQDNVVLSGWIKSQDGSTNLLLAKTWPNGTTIFAKGLREAYSDIPGYDIKPDGNGNYIVAGTIKLTPTANATNSNLTSIYVTKINMMNTTSPGNTPTPSPQAACNFTSLIQWLILALFVLVVAAGVIKKYWK